MSAAARAYLETNLDELERRASDPAWTRKDRYPYDQATGRMLLKIGRSDSDVIVRFRNQTRTTALPEEPILLRGRVRRQLTPTPTRQFLHRISSTDDRSKGSMHARLIADADHAVSSA